jgi:2-polyprenyl-6-methoxyphenol hydroxylase-like FAD-dependent oxidoreductase
MNADVVIVGGGIGGSALATVLAKSGKKVLVLEREAKFKDRVRGENILPWGVARARRIGVLDDLVAAGGHPATFFNIYAMGMQTEHRPTPQTTPSGERMLNMYHPDLQETLLASAVKAGAEVKRGANVQDVLQQDGKWTVTFAEDGRTHSVTPRIVVGCDGRFSQMRKWGGFTVNRDPENLRVAGALVQGTKVPEDCANLCLGPGIGSFVAPLGNGRARMYFVYIGAMGDRKLSGKDKVGEFVEALRSSLAPAEWFDGIEIIGPLAEFEGNDHWVTSPSKPGLALIGDAAAATDPSWGCGLSKTLVDVETLSTCLTETDDWTAALERYAAAHDDYYKKLHNILSWMTELVWTGGPAADERRARVFPRMHEDPTGFPDSIGQGPFGPSDERARRLILGEE